MKSLTRIALISLTLLHLSALALKAQPEDKSALVQIFVSGLAVVEPSGNNSVIHFPHDNGHRLHIWKGEPNSGGVTKHGWFTNRDLEITIKKYTIAPVPIALEPPPAYSLPFDAVDAASSKWLLRAAEVDGVNHSYVPETADSKVTFSRGVVETCGLSVDSDLENSCVMQIEGVSSLVRTLSELVVIRGEVKYDPEAEEEGQVEIDCVGLGCPANGFPIIVKPVELAGCVAAPEKCVTWTFDSTTKTYKYVADVFLVNIPANSGNTKYKVMSSNHVSHLAARHHPKPAKMRNLITPNCVQDGSKPCVCGGIQPACFQYYSRYFPSKNSSTGPEALPPAEVAIIMDASICPLSGYP